jgi:hypothetical protein
MVKKSGMSLLCDIIFTRRLRILRNLLIITLSGSRAASVGKSSCSSAVCKSKTAREKREDWRGRL